MNKDILKMLSLCNRVSDAWEKYGVIAFGNCGDKGVHMVEERFIEYFPDYEIVHLDEEYDELRKNILGVKFYCLRRKEDEQ